MNQHVNKEVILGKETTILPSRLRYFTKASMLTQTVDFAENASLYLLIDNITATE